MDQSYTTEDFTSVYGDDFSIDTGYENSYEHEEPSSEHGLYSSIYFGDDEISITSPSTSGYAEAETSSFYSEENDVYSGAENIKKPVKVDKEQEVYFSEVTDKDDNKGVYFGDEEEDNQKHKTTGSNVSDILDQKTSIDWNKEFQEILLLDDSDIKFTRLSALANNFVFLAETYGKIIISELHLPNKSIKPVSIGGIAGGEKYIVQGILFKFAIDIQGIYGGEENAQKAAGHELKGLGHYWLSNVQDLNFPLMAIVNYCGFCLIALSVLPVSKDTLRYGSADGGKTVHKDNSVLNRKMQEAATKMNLKGHLTGIRTPTLIYGPGDIEGHIGKDNKFYILDFARTFPPEAILPGDKQKEKGRVLYKLLRPELVVSNPIPLSSDAFTGWGRADPDWRIHNDEVTMATRRLFLKVIPELVVDLTEDNIKTFTTDMNIRGINLRHMGFIRSLLVRSGKDSLADVVLLEIISRSMRSILTENWRDIVSTYKLINIDMLKTTTVNMLNLLVENSEQADTFWKEDIKKMMLTKYRTCLVGEELSKDFDLRKSIPRQDLLVIYHRICHIAGVKLTSRAESDLNKLPETVTILSPWDIASISPTVKHMHITDFADMQALFFKGLNTSQELEAERFFSLAIQKLEDSPHISLYAAEKLHSFASILSNNASKWDNSSAMVELAGSFYETAARLRPELRDSIYVDVAILFKNSAGVRRDLVRDKFQLAIENAPSLRAFLEFGFFLITYDGSEASPMFLRALELDPNCEEAHLGLFIVAIYHLYPRAYQPDSATILEDALVHIRKCSNISDINVFEKHSISLGHSSLPALIYCTSLHPSLLFTCEEILSKSKVFSLKDDLLTDKSLEVIVDSPVIYKTENLLLSSTMISPQTALKLLLKLDHALLNTAKITSEGYAEVAKHMNTFSNLTSLELGPLIGVDTLEFIFSLSRIQSLAFSGISLVDNQLFSRISTSFPSLTHIDIRGTSTDIESISVLPAMKNLVYVAIIVNSIEEVESLLQVKNICYFNIKGSDINNIDLLKYMFQYVKDDDSKLEVLYGAGGEPYVFKSEKQFHFLNPVNALIASFKNEYNNMDITVHYRKVHTSDTITFVSNYGSLAYDFVPSVMLATRSLTVKVASSTVYEVATRFQNSVEITGLDEKTSCRVIQTNVQIGDYADMKLLGNRVTVTYPPNTCFNAALIKSFGVHIIMKKFL